MTRPARIGLFAVSAAGLSALLLWAVAGLPDFGHYKGRYGATLNKVTVSERHATNVVTAIVFDYRGFDTLGEEFILFTSVMGVALLLRDVREEERRPRDEVESDPVRMVGIGFSAALLVMGMYIVAHGAITPGGGFQGGVVLAAAFALVYLAADYRSYRNLTPHPGVDFVEGTGAGGYALIGIASMLLGSAFLHTFGPFGTPGTLASAGSIPFLNVASALEVGAAFVLLFSEFLEELVVTRVQTK
jgi:multicomponent Na+:H+ antiporter subunit B